jgi:hypothetical protein
MDVKFRITLRCFNYYCIVGGMLLDIKRYRKLELVSYFCITLIWNQVRLCYLFYDLRSPKGLQPISYDHWGESMWQVC